MDFFLGLENIYLLLEVIGYTQKNTDLLLFLCKLNVLLPSKSWHWTCQNKKKKSGGILPTLDAKWVPVQGPKHATCACVSFCRSTNWGGVFALSSYPGAQLTCKKIWTSSDVWMESPKLRVCHCQGWAAFTPSVKKSDVIITVILKKKKKKDFVLSHVSVSTCGIGRGRQTGRWALPCEHVWWISYQIRMESNSCLVFAP